MWTMDRETFRTSQHLLETDGEVHARFMVFNHQAIAEESSQYICPGLQCFVLGDSQVGKTSFVRSLTGERFATEQTKTPRIEERIVDKKWNTLEFTKDHATGKFIPFFKETLVRSMSFGRDRKEPLSDSTKLDCMAVLKVIFLYADQIKDLLRGMLLYALQFMFVLLSFFHILSCTVSPFVNLLLRSVTYIFVLIHCGSLIRCTLQGISLFGVIVAFLAVMMTVYSSGIFEILLYWKIIASLVLLTNTVLRVVVEGTLWLLVFTVEWFQNHLDQDKIEFGKIRRTLELLSLMVVGFTGFSTTMALLLLPMASNLHLADLVLRVSMSKTPGLLILLLACYAFIAPKIFKVQRSRKALIVFVTISFCITLILLPTTIHCAAIFASFSLSIFNLEWHRMYLSEITPVVTYIGCNVLQLMDASCDAFLHTALVYWEKLKLVYMKGKFLKVKVLDFVGDREYYSYHHLFFRRDALYIIVFNLSEFANEDFRDVCTQIQRLQFWLKSICSRVPHWTQILLVGTHGGKLDFNCIKILNNLLKSFLSEKYCGKVMENDVDRLVFFPVENTLGNEDTGIKELQSKIMSVASEQQKRIIIEHNIPLQWILIQDVIMKHKISSDAKFCVSLDEFQRMIMEDFVLLDKCRLSKDMLKYFHEIGLIIYVDKRQDFDLSNWILVCPEKLIDVFINISSKPVESTKYRGSLKYDWNLLQRKGMLTKKLLQSLLSKLEKEEEAIIAFLEHYGLICPLEYKGITGSTKCDCDIQPTHFVPSLLPLSANGDTPVWHKNDGDKKFYVFFINFLPEALFHQLLSRAQKNSAIEFRNGETVLYRDAGKFWMNPWLSYQLTLIEEEEMIEVTYNSSHKNKKEPSDVLCQVFSMVDGICKSYFPLVKFHCGPACPSDTCPGHQDDYFTSLPAEEGNGTRRRHVYNIMPGRQGNRAAYLYCENNCLEDELYEWIP
ncbi:uncharacterized protein [Acropora muricata]|uniref:uncharacterized protein n=1 Tax=Acropora muricata TaxID=159855 RepID=UPI0034E418D5